MKKIFNYSFILSVITFFIIGIGVGASFFGKGAKISTGPKMSPYTAFTGEIYYKIMENYWDNITDTQLLDFYRLAFAKFLTTDTSTIKDKAGLLAALDKELKNKDEKD